MSVKSQIAAIPLIILAISLPVSLLQAGETLPTRPRPAFPAYFEPSEASATSTDLTAKCDYQKFNVSLTSSERTIVRKFEFAGREMNAEQYRTLNGWVSQLRGHVEVRVLCNSAGVKLVLEEAFNRDKDKRRIVDIDYVGDKLHLNSPQ